MFAENCILKKGLINYTMNLIILGDPYLLWRYTRWFLVSILGVKITYLEERLIKSTTVCNAICIDIYMYCVNHWGSVTAMGIQTGQYVSKMSQLHWLSLISPRKNGCKFRDDKLKDIFVEKLGWFCYLPKEFCYLGCDIWEDLIGLYNCLAPNRGQAIIYHLNQWWHS